MVCANSQTEPLTLRAVKLNTLRMRRWSLFPVCQVNQHLDFCLSQPAPTASGQGQPVRWLLLGEPCIRQGEGNGTPLQYCCPENPMDGGAWEAAVHGAAKSQTRLSDFTFTFHFHALEKEMATHSSVLAWRIPGTGEPGGLQSMGPLRVRHD